MRKSGLSGAMLCQAVAEMAAGLLDADLGGGIVKKCVALPGRGKRGSARTIVATRMAGCWFFLYGFSKNERDNIDTQELKAFQELARGYLALSDSELEVAVKHGKFVEVYDCDGKT